MRLIVDCLAVAEHSHNIREDHTGSVVLVGVEEDTQALKHVLGSKDGALRSAILGHPHGEAIAEEVALAIDAELHFDLPIGGCQGDSREDPSRL